MISDENLHDGEYRILSSRISCSMNVPLENLSRKVFHVAHRAYQVDNSSLLFVCALRWPIPANLAIKMRELSPNDHSLRFVLASSLLFSSILIRSRFTQSWANTRNSLHEVS